ncbi:MAG: SDR family oxidoreductase [Vicinamibacterales bacterium]
MLDVAACVQVMPPQTRRDMVLLVGGTGQLGGRIARELLSRGVKVRALCRNGSGYGALRRMGADIAIGDLKDPESLSNACAGADIVMTTANSGRRGGDDTVDTVDVAGSRALIDAARQAGVVRFIYTSVWGATAESPVPFIRAKAGSEAYLKASGMAWTILAPNAFMESWPGMVVGAPAAAGRDVVVVGEGRRRHAFVAEHDVAQFATAAVMNDATRNRHLPIGGPAAHSWLDVVQIYEEALGRAIAVRHVEPGTRVDGVPDALLALLAGLDTFDSDFDSSALASALGVMQTPLAAWVRASLATLRGRSARL